MAGEEAPAPPSAFQDLEANQPNGNYSRTNSNGVSNRGQPSGSGKPRNPSRPNVLVRKRSKSRHAFVDYVPPPPTPIQAPSKYKQWILVFCQVYLGQWVTTEADVRGFFMRRCHLSFLSAQLVLFVLIVFTIMFASNDLIVHLLKFKIGDKSYGPGPWLKQPRIKWCHEYNNWFVRGIAHLIVILEDGFDLFKIPPPAEEKKVPVFDAEDGEKNDSPGSDGVELKLENKVRSEHIQTYNAWREKFFAEVLNHQQGLKSIETDFDPNSGMHISYLTFDTIDNLNAFMASPVRQRLRRKVTPLLEVPSQAQLVQNRTLPDAFTDLFHGQGNPVPKRLPKKWKVWSMTALGLWLVYIINRQVMPHYYEEMGVNDSHERVQSLVRILTNSFMSVYICIPFLTMLFGHWLKRKDGEKDEDEPWRTLNDGFETYLSRAFILLAFYGSCIIAWALKD